MSNIQHIPHDGKRIETGAVQFGDNLTGKIREAKRNPLKAIEETLNTIHLSIVNFTKSCKQKSSKPTADSR